MQKENRELKDRLDTVINSTWNLSGDGWSNTPNNLRTDLPGSLVLKCEDPNRPSNSNDVWKVDQSFRDSKKIEELKAGKVAGGFKKKDTYLTSGASRTGMEMMAFESEGMTMTQVQSMMSMESTPTGDFRGPGSMLEPSAGPGWRDRFIVNPTSRKRLGWDICGMFLLLYDLIFIPVSAFLTVEVVQGLMDWMTLIFWTCDIVASLFTGYVSPRGNIIMLPQRIARNYMRSRWFVLDLIIVVPDWIGTIGELASQGSESGTSGAAGLLRVFRVIRIMRLLRISKVKRLMTILQDNIESESVYFIMRLTQLLVLLLFAGHFMAAGWWYVGNVGYDRELSNGESWIEAYHMRDRSVLYRYLTSLHWALANFAPGASANVFPANSGERFCSVLAVVLGAATFGLLTAWTTSALITLQKANDDVNKQFWLLRQFMRQNDVPSSLRMRILRYLNSKLGSSKDMIQESKLEVLSMLSSSLQAELKYAVSFQDLLTHPLIGHLHEKFPVAKHGLARSALSVVNFARNETVVARNTVMTSMYYIKSGMLDYRKGSELPVKVTKDDWIGEMCLWVQWASRGEAVTKKQNCEAIVLDSTAFDEVVKQDESLLHLVSHYADVFSEWLAAMDPQDVTDVFYGSRSIILVESFVMSAKKAHRAHKDLTCSDIS